MGGGLQKIVKGSPPKTLLKDIIYRKVTHSRRVLLIIDTCSQVLNIWKQVSPTILRSKIFLGIGAGSGVPGGAQAPPELFLAPPEPFEPPLTIKTIMH